MHMSEASGSTKEQARSPRACSLPDGRYPDGSRHHVPDRCLRCDIPTERRQAPADTWYPGRGGEPYWWCPQCGGASVCACMGCVTLRTLANL